MANFVMSLHTLGGLQQEEQVVATELGLLPGMPNRSGSMERCMNELRTMAPLGCQNTRPPPHDSFMLKGDR